MKPHDPRIWLAGVAIGLLSGVAPTRAGEPTKLSIDKAASYLDARAAEWAAFQGADRGEGADKVSCVSCHTSLSYAPRPSRGAADQRRLRPHRGGADPPR